MISFRKKVKILPGLSLNFSKSGVSTTIGTRGASVTFGKKGTYVNAGIPGTGIYTRKKVSGTTTSRSGRRSGVYSPSYSVPESRAYRQASQTYVPVDTSLQVPLRSKAANQAWGTVFVIVGIVSLILAFVSPLLTVGRFLIGGVGIFCIIVGFCYFSAKSIEDETKEEEVKEEKRREVKIQEAKEKVTVPAMKEIPPYSDQPSAATAFDTACLNFGLATTIDDILNNTLKATECLAYAKSPLDESWGSNNVLPLYVKMRTRRDDALIRVALNIRNVGGDYSDIQALLATDTGKAKWESTFA